MANNKYYNTILGSAQLFYFLKFILVVNTSLVDFSN